MRPHSPCLFSPVAIFHSNMSSANNVRQEELDFDEEARKLFEMLNLPSSGAAMPGVAGHQPPRALPRQQRVRSCGGGCFRRWLRQVRADGNTRTGPFTPLSSSAYSHCASCTLAPGSPRAWQSAAASPGFRLS